MNFYKRHLGDYAKDAGHLSMIEHGAYSMLLDRYYTTEKPIANRAEALRMCRARSSAERAAVDTVLAEFFVTEGDAFVNRRAEEEIEKAAHQRTVNQAIGKLGGRPKGSEPPTETKAKGNPIGSESQPNRNPSQTPDSRLHSDVEHPRRRASRLPQGWEPTTEDLGYASEHGLANGKIAIEAERFRNYWSAKSGSGATKQDWPATWRNWVLKASEESAPTKNAFEGAI